MTQFLVGTGGWSYFKPSNKPPLEAYSELFNFAEVNCTFYQYPSLKTVERWRKTVPADFVFSVRCHQDLTHKIGLKPTNEAFEIFNKMKAYCEVLEAPFLVLQTPHSQAFDETALKAAEDFFSAITLGDDLRIVWEFRPDFSLEVMEMMINFDITRCVDLSCDIPILCQEIVYSRLFGKGKHNIYQFTDGELLEIEQNADLSRPDKIVLAYHGTRMYTDALRSQWHRRTGEFLPVTNAVGVESARAVLSEDAHFPTSKAHLIADQGWKVIDLTADSRVHLSIVLKEIPEKTYHSIDEVVGELRAVI
jgi:uncharacterized protein YecE (DUF72 family)